MAYNYLGLVNDVAGRMNEPVLTSSTFPTATGVHSAFKEAVNSSVRHVNQAHYYWPFNHNLEQEILSAGVSRYSLPENAKYVDFGSFRLLRDSSINVNRAKQLSQLTYSEYLGTYVDQEYETDSTKGDIPRNVVRTPDSQFIVVPMPNAAYTIEYEYYSTPVDLSLYDDVPTIPEQFRHVIVDGAMYYAYMFRDNIEMGNLSQSKFENGIKQMRSILVNEYAYFRAN